MARYQWKLIRAVSLQQHKGNAMTVAIVNHNHSESHDLHPLCTLFPRMSGSEFDALVHDISVNGLRQPIITHGGMILDGGNRYRACIEAGVAPKFVKFDGENLVSFVLSANLHRRHMSPGQQAAIVASAQDWGKAQPVGGTGANQHANKEQTGNVAALQTVADRAAQSGASERTQRMADKVAKADPALAIQVAHGEVSLPRAVAKVSVKKPSKPAVEAQDTPAEYADASSFDDDEVDAQAEIERLAADNEMMGKVFDADDKLGAAMAELKQATEENRVLRERVNGLMNEKNAAVKQAKMWRNKFEKLEKAAA